MTPQFIRKTHFPISVSYNVYPSDQQYWLKRAFWLKRADLAKIPYLVNQWSYEDDRPLILFARPTFLLMFDIMYIHQSNSTVNDRISARGAYSKIIFLRGRLFEPGRLNGSGRLLNYSKIKKTIYFCFHFFLCTN